MMKYIFGNWKMAQTLETATKFVEDWKLHQNLNLKVVVFPSAPHLKSVIDLVAQKKSALEVGGQDCSTEEKGAYTGEVSTLMLKEVGCKYVLVGHSERRMRGAETESTLKRKVELALRNGLTPVYCLGETEAERNAGRVEEILKKQAAVVAGISENFLVAYEPVWAIGTGKTATNSDIEKAHKLLRSLLPEKVAILYGGSVNASNAREIMTLKNVDGVLVGGASVKPADFSIIAESAI